MVPNYLYDSYHGFTNEVDQTKLFKALLGEGGRWRTLSRTSSTEQLFLYLHEDKQSSKEEECAPLYLMQHRLQLLNVC